MFQKKWGGKVAKHPRRTLGGNECWHWRLAVQGNVARFLEEIRPHVIVKKEEVELAFEFLNSLRRVKSELLDETAAAELLLRGALRERMKALKSRGVVG